MARYEALYRPKARSRLVPGQHESLRRITWLRSAGRGGAVRTARIAVKPSSLHSRRCLVQARFQQAGRIVNGKPIDLQASARHHLAYIEREGVERDGGPGRLYGTDQATEPQRAADDVRSRLAEPVAGERHQFRFIISPEDAHQLDMTEFVRELMARVERDIGRPIIWGAVNHYNTAHPHAHVVVRGVDRDGREVRFDREYIKAGFRSRAEELATEWLGPRTELERHEQLEREVEQQRYTTLDRGIAAKARSGPVRHADLSEHQRRRMHCLEALGLAQRAPEGTWQLRQGWDRTLRRLGERGDLIKEMHRAMQGVDASRFVVCDDRSPANPTEGTVIHGRVVAKGLRDNVPEGMYAMIETVRGSGYHIALSPSQAESIREGDHVTLRWWTDRQGRMRPAIDRSRMSIEQQVTYVGPTWLDAAQPSGGGKLAGEVQRRRHAREAFLRGHKLWGVDLRSAERRRLTERYARQLGKRRARGLDGFTGRVVEIHEAPSGHSYAVVANADEVLLLRATAKTRAWVGQEVRVSLANEQAQQSGRQRGPRLDVQPIERER